MYRKRILLGLCLAVTITATAYSFKNFRTFAKELHNAQMNYSSTIADQKKSVDFASIRDEANRLLKLQIIPFSEAELYAEIASISGKVDVTNISYTKPTSVDATQAQAQPATQPATVPPTAPATVPPTTPATNTQEPLDRTTMYITLRGDVLPFLANLDQKIQFTVMSYSKTSSSETVVIKIGGGE